EFQSPSVNLIIAGNERTQYPDDGSGSQPRERSRPPETVLAPREQQGQGERDPRSETIRATEEMLPRQPPYPAESGEGGRDDTEPEPERAKTRGQYQIDHALPPV